MVKKVINVGIGLLLVAVLAVGIGLTAKPAAAQGPWDLTVTTTAGGTVTAPGVDTFEDYADGTDVTLTAVPDNGYAFLFWNPHAVVATKNAITDWRAASTIIDMDADHTIEAHFV